MRSSRPHRGSTACSVHNFGAPRASFGVPAGSPQELCHSTPGDVPNNPCPFVWRTGEHRFLPVAVNRQFTANHSLNQSGCQDALGMPSTQGDLFLVGRCPATLALRTVQFKASSSSVILNCGGGYSNSLLFSFRAVIRPQSSGDRESTRDNAACRLPDQISCGLVAEPLAAADRVRRRCEREQG